MKQPISRGSHLPTKHTDVAIVGIGVHCAAGKQYTRTLAVATSRKKCDRPRSSPTVKFCWELSDDREHFAGLVNDGCEFDSEFFGSLREKPSIWIRNCACCFKQLGTP